MFKKKRFLLLVFFCVVFISLNALTEEEKQELGERIKISYFARLDSLIANNKLIESVVESDVGTMQAFGGDPRQIIIFYKYIRYGDDGIQKRGIDRIPNWYGNPKRAEKFKQDSIYVNYKPKVIKVLYDLLEDKSSVLQVSAARTLVYMGISNSLVIDKLEYYANSTNSDKWNVENTGYPAKNSSFWKGKTDKERRNVCIRIIVNAGKQGLEILEDRINNKNNSKIEFKDNEKEVNELNLNIRDLDWNGETSAEYCNLWWGGLDPLNQIYNPAYANYASVGGDCANFASQCLIAGYYEDITYSPDADTCGCISNCPNLHNYMSSRFDVETIVVDFHTNGWENLSEPNNHIPANFSVGDIAVLGKQIWGADSLYQHAIICHGYDTGGNHLFGAHSNNRIDKDMAWFIGSNINNLDYATFYHITNDWNCNTQIAGGAVSGTWTHENSPYCINGEITIPQGSQLTIEPGVDVIFTGHYKFNIYGRLLAEGDWQRYINFVPQDSTTGWHSLRFYDQNTNGQDSSKVVYCKLQYGKAVGDTSDVNGGAIYLENSNILIDNCIISHNSATGGGGGIFIYNSSDPTIKRTIISDNTSENAGGGIHILDGCTPTLENVCIYNNEAVSEISGRGGGIYCDDWCFPILTNVTFSLNTANYDSSYPGGGLFSCNNSYPNLLNCILWNDIPQEIGEGYSRFVIVTYSDVEGGSPGEGNIDTDPLFADPVNGDFQITWANYPVNDATKSPCIDTGSLSLPLDPDSTIADMGALYFHQYETGSAPQNVTVYIDADSVYLSWSIARHRSTYKVYSSNNPYSDFEEDLTGTYNETSWTAPLPTADDKKFYYVTSVN